MERPKIFEKSLLMLATFQLLPNLLKDEPDIAILFLMSDVPPSSLATLTPRYANCTTLQLQLLPTFRLTSLILLTPSTLHFFAISFN